MFGLIIFVSYVNMMLCRLGRQRIRERWWCLTCLTAEYVEELGGDGLLA